MPPPAVLPAPPSCQRVLWTYQRHLMRACGSGGLTAWEIRRQGLGSPKTLGSQVMWMFLTRRWTRICVAALDRKCGCARGRGRPRCPQPATPRSSAAFATWTAHRPGVGHRPSVGHGPGAVAPDVPSPCPLAPAADEGWSAGWRLRALMASAGDDGGPPGGGPVSGAGDGDGGPSSRLLLVMSMAVVPSYSPRLGICAAWSIRRFQVSTTSLADEH